MDCGIVNARVALAWIECPFRAILGSKNLIFPSSGSRVLSGAVASRVVWKNVIHDRGIGLVLG